MNRLRKNFLVLLLILSTGLNLLFVGIVIGRYVFEMTPERGHFKWISREVSDSTRSKLRLNIREQMQKTLPARIELRKAQQQVKSAIATDDYQKSDVVEGLANVRKASFELQSFMHAQMVDNLQELSPEERRIVVSFMMHPKTLRKKQTE